MYRLIDRLRAALRKPVTTRATGRGQRGVALLMVLLLLALLGSVVADFQFNSRIDLQLATNARDEIQAEYNALTALRMRSLLLKHSGRLQQMMNGLQGALGGATGGAAGAQAGGGGSMLPITQLLEVVPIECGLLSAIAKKKNAILEDDDIDLDAEATEDEFFQGECIAVSQSEHSKISINMLRRRTNGSDEALTGMLMGILSDLKMERHFQEDDRNDTHAESPQELIGAITDWTDDDSNQVINQVSDEERFYDLLKDSYKVKNAPFDSLAEIQLVHGIDDELYQLLKGNVSIYGDGTQLDLTTTPPERIVMWGIPAAMPPGGTADQIPVEMLAQLYKSLVEFKQLTFGFGTLNVAALRAMVTQVGLDAYIDSNRLGQVFTDKGGTTWYTIEAQGRSGSVSRRIRAVFQTQEAQFYYIRME